MQVNIDHTLDAKGLSCPMPIVKTKQYMSKLKSGEVLEVLTTDSGSAADLKAWAASSGEHYIKTIENQGVYKHYIEKSGNEKVSEHMPFEVTASLEEIQKKLNEPNVTILDVREPEEFANGHIPGAVNIPLDDIENRSHELNDHHHIYIICRTGNRSDFAAKKLANKGFEKLANVIPGMISWTSDMKTINGGNK